MIVKKATIHIILSFSLGFLPLIIATNNILTPCLKFRNAIEPFKQMNLTRIVTLGNSCLTKMRVNSFLQSVMNKSENRKLEGYNHLFDWMAPLNYSLMAEALRNNFTDAFGKDYLSVLPDPRRKNGLVYVPKYQFRFGHVFEKIKGVPSSLPILELIENYYHLVDAKYQHLIKKSQLAFSTEERTLYLIHSSSAHAVPAGQRQEDFLNLLAAIKETRDENFLLLVLVTHEMKNINHYDFDEVIGGNLIFHEIEQFLNPKWNSPRNVNQWNDILSSIFF